MSQNTLDAWLQKQQPQNVDSSEESESSHSFDDKKPISNTINQYITTNLITKSNLNISEITLEKLSYVQVEYAVRNAFKQLPIFTTKTEIIDPKRILKDAKNLGTVETLVDLNDIQALLEGAIKMHITYVQNTNHDQPQEGSNEIANLQQLSSNIIHNHTRNMCNEELKDDGRPKVVNLLKPIKESQWKRKQKEQ